jgi:hypothetical protein
MHVQAAVHDYDLFTRTISIGPQSAVTNFDPSQEYHYVYSPLRDPDAPVWELETISRTINAFFRWDWNSCETIVKDGDAHPIDYANAAPDAALMSLHYFFPWTIRSLVAWCIFCRVIGRQMRINQNTRDYFAIGDRDELSYDEKLVRYRELADEHFQADGFAEFCEAVLPNLEELTVEYVESDEFDDLRVQIVRAEERPEMHEELIERNRRLVGEWIADQRAGALAR